MNHLPTTELARARRLTDRPRASAFTLIEVLVVISILALLMAILVPSLRVARETARRTLCQANLKQIAVAWTEYLDDHDGYFLQGLEPLNPNVNFGGKQGRHRAFGSVCKEPPDPACWPTGAPRWLPVPECSTEVIPKPLNTYLGLPEVVFEGAEAFHCPCDVGGPRIRPSYFEYVGNSYEANLFLIGQDQIWYPSNNDCAEMFKQVNRWLPRMNRLRVSNPGKTLLLGDSGWVNTWQPWKRDIYEWHRRPVSYNLAFLDTHVEFLRIERGRYVTKDYAIIPFGELHGDAVACQEGSD